MKSVELQESLVILAAAQGAGAAADTHMEPC